MIQIGRAKPTHLNTERGVKKKPGSRRDRLMDERKNAECAPTDRYAVELRPGMWLANWFGYPGKTMLVKNAKRFETIGDALDSVNSMKRVHGFRDAMVVELNSSPLKAF